MKKLFYLIILLALSVTVYSQSVTPSTVFDQNPRYKESLERYSKMIDSLISWHGITIQHTYKAYDWREARDARREQRKLWRHEERMNRSYYNDYYWPDYYPYRGYNYYYPNYRYPYYNPYYNPYGPRWRRYHFGVGMGYSW
ncbi:MAG: hypothetical protein U0X71_00605 [Sphingobacteriaceae bacterium]|nr:MAG: hypothetical protein E6Q66_02855 [Pedobacter sp.]